VSSIEKLFDKGEISLDHLGMKELAKRTENSYVPLDSDSEKSDNEQD